MVVLLLAILAYVALPRLSSSATSAKSLTCESNVSLINTRMDLQFLENGVWPQNLNEFGADTESFPGGLPECPFGNSYSMHEETHHVNPHSH